MKRSELEPIIGAAGAITRLDDFVVIGSQSILGERPDELRKLGRADLGEKTITTEGTEFTEQKTERIQRTLLLTRSPRSETLKWMSG